MKHWFWWLWLVILAAACQTQVATPPATATISSNQTLRIGVSASAITLAELVAEPYTKQAERVILQFIPANNDTLFSDLISGQLDAILVHHIPENSPGWVNPVALDGLAIIVHLENPVQRLSLAEVQAIFNGRITNWLSLGGLDQPITLMSREHGAGTRTIFQQRVMAEQRISINALIQPDNQTLLEAVKSDHGAIGFTMMGSAIGLYMPAIDGISPTPSETAVQNYPLTVPLYFVSPDEPTGELRAFLAWIQSDAGQSLIGEKYGRVR